MHCVDRVLQSFYNHYSEDNNTHFLTQTDLDPVIFTWPRIGSQSPEIPTPWQCPDLHNWGI